MMHILVSALKGAPAAFCIFSSF